MLVLEDEPQLLKLMARVLERAGHAVVRTSHGDDALLVLQDPNQTIDATVIDMAIPPAGAGSLLEQFDQFRKDLPVVVTSGDLIDSELRDSLDRRHGVFLRKPFVPQALVQAVADASRGRQATLAESAAVSGDAG